MDDPVRNPFVSPSKIGDPDGSPEGVSVTATVRTGQIITLALAQGLLIMAAILGFLSVGAGPPQDPFVFRIVGLAVMVSACGAAAIVPAIMRRAAIAQVQPGDRFAPMTAAANPLSSESVKRLVGAFHSSTLVGQAFLEGAATINLVLMFINHDFIHLIFAAIGLIGIVLLTPTVGKVHRMLENTQLL